MNRYNFDLSEFQHEPDAAGVICPPLHLPALGDKIRANPILGEVERPNPATFRPQADAGESSRDQAGFYHPPKTCESYLSSLSPRLRLKISRNVSKAKKLFPNILTKHPQNIHNLLELLFVDLEIWVNSKFHRPSPRIAPS